MNNSDGDSKDRRDTAEGVTTGRMTTIAVVSDTLFFFGCIFLLQKNCRNTMKKLEGTPRGLTDS